MRAPLSLLDFILLMRVRRVREAIADAKAIQLNILAVSERRGNGHKLDNKFFVQILVQSARGFAAPLRDEL
jgi:hypothetical protein